MQRVGLAGIAISADQIKSAKRMQYNSGYDGFPKGKIGIAASMGNCWDSGKEDKDAGLPKTPRCGNEPVGGRKRRHRKTRKHSKKHSKRTRKH